MWKNVNKNTCFQLVAQFVFQKIRNAKVHRKLVKDDFTTFLDKFKLTGLFAIVLTKRIAIILSKLFCGRGAILVFEQVSNF